MTHIDPVRLEEILEEIQRELVRLDAAMERMQEMMRTGRIRDLREVNTVFATYTIVSSVALALDSARDGRSESVSAALLEQIEESNQRHLYMTPEGYLTAMKDNLPRR